MSWRLVIAPAFVRDTESIRGYLSDRVAIESAVRTISQIQDKLLIIAENPLAYVERSGLGPKW
jgi:plasmid stabilization system protein ParE